jgi:FkbM family methyltransferase
MNIDIKYDYTRLPNGMRVAHVNPGETGLLYRRIFSDQGYMRHGVTLHPGDTVVDVGANIGIASLFFSQLCSDIVIYAFEPAPIPFAALAENMRLHRIRGECRQLALGKSTGVCNFTYYPKTTVMSGMYADVAEDSALTERFLRKSGFNEEDTAEILAEKYERQLFAADVSTLSREAAALGIRSIDLLKLDVEKSELQVLQGVADEDWPRLKQIVAEVHDIAGGLDQFTGLLRSRGFRVVAEQEEQLKGTEIYAVFATRAPEYSSLPKGLNMTGATTLAG